MIDRRTFLGAAATLVVAGCGGTSDVLGLRPAVRVAVSWSGPELRAFQRVLDGLGRLDYPVEVVPLGDTISTAFGPRSSRRPDIVMLPQPGLVSRHRNDLEPIPPDLAERARTRLWSGLLVLDGTTYGLPFKTAHKSAVWYRPSVLRRFGLAPPRHWNDWLAVNRMLSQAGVRPLSLAAGDGWVLTDFLENVLLAGSPSTYRALAIADPPRLSEQPAVGAALRLLGAMWSPPGTLAGGVERSLVQQFPDAVVEVFGHRRAAMVLASDFAEPVIRSFAVDRADVGLFTFPPVGPVGTGPVLVGGDVIVLPRPASEDALDLVRRLVAPSAADPWVGTGGFLAEGRTTGYSPELTRLAAQLVAPGTVREFDLSDRLGRLGDINGLWRVLTDFLVRVGNRGSGVLPVAVDAAMAQLKELEG